MQNLRHSRRSFYATVVSTPRYCVMILGIVGHAGIEARAGELGKHAGRLSLIWRISAGWKRWSTAF